MRTEPRRIGRPATLPERQAIRDTTIGVRMPKEEKERASELAASEGRSISNFIRFIYQKGLAQYEAELARTAAAA